MKSGEGKKEATRGGENGRGVSGKEERKGDALHGKKTIQGKSHFWG